MKKALLLDVDGVLTDGRIYTDGSGAEMKSLNLKDIDAITSIRKEGSIVGLISGEDTSFSRNLQKYVDYAKLGCKDKVICIKEFCEEYKIEFDEIVYVGDGKYDIDVLKLVGCSICPADAIRAVREVAQIVLTTKGGMGCISELYDDYWNS